MCRKPKVEISYSISLCHNVTSHLNPKKPKKIHKNKRVKIDSNAKMLGLYTTIHNNKNKIEYKL